MQWILVWIIFTGFVSQSSHFQTSGKLTKMEIMETMDTHNSLRRFFTIKSKNIANMRQLKWDDDLETEALQFASCDILESEMNVEPSSSEIIESIQTTQGMNMAITSQHSIKEVIEDWFSQGQHYDLINQFCDEQYDCNNFLQLVFADAHKLGCAVRHGCEFEGELKKVFVCIYYPGYNFLQPLYKTGAICSKCDYPTSFCHHNLCASCQPDKKHCNCRKTCKGNESYGYLETDSCTCACVRGMGPNCDEPCINPSHHEDWDICSDSDSSSAACAHPETGAWLRLYCPANCSPGCQNKTLRQRRKAISQM